MEENEIMYDFKDAFIIRPTNEENNDFIITLGNTIATPYHFETREEAQKLIDSKDWNLTATLIISLAEHAVKKYLTTPKKKEK